MDTKPKTTLIDINDITKYYLPVSKRKARKFVSLYLEPKKIGNRIFVDREKLETLLDDSDRNTFPLDL